MALTVDTRTATEYGVVRTFAQGDFQFNNFGTQNGATPSFGPGGGIGSAGTSGSTGFPTAGQLSGLNGNLLNNPGGGYVAVDYVLIQFAGFTFGKSSSAYATPWNGYPGNNTSFLIGGHDTVTGVNNIQYTAQFGNGVSGTIGLDDPTVFNRVALYNLSTGIGGNGLGTTPTAAGSCRTSSATSASTRLGVCSRFRARCTTVNGSYNNLGAFNTPCVTSDPRRVIPRPSSAAR